LAAPFFALFGAAGFLAPAAFLLTLFGAAFFGAAFLAVLFGADLAGLDAAALAIEFQKLGKIKSLDQRLYTSEVKSSFKLQSTCNSASLSRSSSQLVELGMLSCFNQINEHLAMYYVIIKPKLIQVTLIDFH
jgi:hypothetical protein